MSKCTQLLSSTAAERHLMDQLTRNRELQNQILQPETAEHIPV